MAAERRLNPAIDPSDIAWQKVLAMFDFHVRTSDKTLDDILLENFTVHEIRQFFTQERADIKALQKRNTERYNALLAGRFKGVPSNVPTKLAMMYFGLPVEPVQIVLKSQDSNALAVMEAQVAQLKPLAFLANDELSHVTVGITGQQAGAMEFNESHQRQFSDVPVTSKSVLTVREQANLLQAFKSMRNIALKRSFPCPFAGCKYAFDPSHPDEAKTHIARVHVSKKCIWCDESHFEWWNEAQRQRHLRQKHRDKLLATLGVTDLKILSSDASEAVTISLTQSPGSVDEVAPGHSTSVPARQLVEIFCGSCGRDNRTFTCPYEKDYHQRSCPGDKLGAQEQAFCAECGDYNNSQGEQGQGRACGHQPNGATGKFCIGCGIDTNLLSRGSDLHRSSCHGRGSPVKPFCPYCGDRLCSNDDTSDHQALTSAHQLRCNPKPAIQVAVPVIERDQAPLPTHPTFSPLTPSPAFTPSPASTEEFRPDFAGSDSESERGRSRRRQKKAAPRNKAKTVKGPERRAPSPDWNVVLGAPDPSFVPDNKYYCSKCLRRVPKANRKRNFKQEPGTGEDYKHHIAGDRCCRIRSGIGSTENLPNRSGWIPASKIPRLGVLKSEFLQVYPDYAATVYPLLSSDTRNNMWRSDPNNETNSAKWNLPWPPFKGGLPSIPEGTNEGSNADKSERLSTGSRFEPDEQDYGIKKRGRRRRRRNADGSYFYETNTDSEDGLSVTDHDEDEDGTSPNKRKRRRLGDPNYRPRRGDESDSDNEPERLRKVREEMEQEILSLQEKANDAQQGVAPTKKEGLDSFIETDDVQAS